MSRHTLYVIFAMLFLFMAGTACEDHALNDISFPTVGSESSEYWYTRALTAAQKLELQRNYGFGFSYDAIYGGKCDMSAIRCQVLNIAKLYDENNIMNRSHATHTLDSSYVAHSFSEYCKCTDIRGEIKGSVLVYSADFKKSVGYYEHGMDTLICFYNKRNVEVRHIILSGNIEDIKEDIQNEPEKFLTPSFLYAIEKIKKTPIEETIVVDSFIDIFGTHVIVDATIGATLTLDIKSRKADIHDYATEEMMLKQKLNLLFTKRTTTLTETEVKYKHQILDNSHVNLSVKGGEASVFNGLITNPSYTNTDATEETLQQWMVSIRNDSLDVKGNVEMIDMDVAPIWEFIPDEEVAKRVKARIISTAPTMQELYGNRNWKNVRIPSSIPSYKVWMIHGNNSKQMNSTCVTNIISADRYVATSCREWVPEIYPNGSVRVAYPIYDNKVDLTAGLCYCWNDVYSVSWRYDRFVVKKVEGAKPKGYFYLTFGCLSAEPVEGITYDESPHYLVDYAWPGSIAVTNGGLKIEYRYLDLPFIPTRKFLGSFYLGIPLKDVKFDDLPNWEYKTSTPYQDGYYKEWLEKTKHPYSASGITIRGAKGTEHLINRMVRNNDYTYYMNPTEVWYEKPQK